METPPAWRGALIRHRCRYSPPPLSPYGSSSRGHGGNLHGGGLTTSIGCRPWPPWAGHTVQLQDLRRRHEEGEEEEEEVRAAERGEVCGIAA